MSDTFTAAEVRRLAFSILRNNTEAGVVSDALDAFADRLQRDEQWAEAKAALIAVIGEIKMPDDYREEGRREVMAEVVALPARKEALLNEHGVCAFCSEPTTSLKEHSIACLWLRSRQSLGV